MNELTPILEQATAAIEPGYFHLNVDGGDPVYRERVYCYELYHQMRMLWPEGTPFYLNGEIDKAARPTLTKLGADYAKPDLLVHRTGYMSGNHAIIEVKSPGASTAGIRSDLAKLSLFISEVGYQRAIYLLFGYQADGILTRVRAVARQFDALAPIELWLHSQPGSPAVPHQ